jgi:hypothetical protein
VAQALRQVRFKSGSPEPEDAGAALLGRAPGACWRQSLAAG